MRNQIITLLTDFGLQDPYVSSMKGIILSIYPKAQIVDISHQINKFNIREAAFKLALTAQYFPSNTIHLVVIDPGVGSARKPLIVSTNHYIFVGPDNGVLSLATEKDGIKRIIEIQNEDFFLTTVSNTFHGRDIFAPVAAYLAKKVPLEKFGPAIKNMVHLDFTEAFIINNEIKGEVLYIDGFGNIITNIHSDLLKKLNFSNKPILQIKFKSKIENIPICVSYNDVDKGKLLAIIDSNNLLEIAANQSDAALLLNANMSDKIDIKLFIV